MSKDWLTQFVANYDGTSPEANELQGYTKNSPRGGVYIPWATIERLARMQDPDLVIDVTKTEMDGLVHTDEFSMSTPIANKATGGVDMVESTAVSHSVEVFVEFLGKRLTDYYPIQDTGTYAAVKVYDQNLVNKSIQRAKARALSRITGLGLRLYESKDLQFEDEGSTGKDPAPVAEVKKPEPAKTTRRQNASAQPRTTPEEEPKQMGDPLPESLDPKPENNYTPEAVSTAVRPEAMELATLLMTHTDQTAVQRFLRLYNNSFQKAYGFTITMNEASIDEVAEKLDKIPEPSKIIAAANAKGIKA